MAGPYYLKAASTVGEWATGTVYTTGQKVVPRRAYGVAAAKFYIFEATTGGTSHGSTEPTWPTTPGNTVNDNDIVWTCRACTTWANANRYLDYLYNGLPSTSDNTIYVSSTHSESSSAGGSCANGTAGSSASPIKVYSVNDGAEPPTALLAGAVIATTGTTGYYFQSSTDIYGITFNVGSGSSNASFGLGTTLVAGGAACTLKSCTINNLGNHVFGRVSLGYNSAIWNTFVFTDCIFSFSNSSQGFAIQAGYTYFTGCSIAAGTTPTNIFGAASTQVVRIVGFDFSNCSSSVNLSSYNADTIFYGCKLPGSWSGAPAASATGYGTGRLIDCDSGDTNYTYWEFNAAGSIKNQVSTLIKTDGASDGVTPFSQRLISTANTGWPGLVLKSLPINLWNTTVGSSITVTVDILRDNATGLKDNEVWLELEYPGGASYPNIVVISDRVADPMTTAATQDSSSSTWDTTGMSNPNAQELSVTFTPQEVGWLIGRVCLAKASTTIYVDPLLMVS